MISASFPWPWQGENRRLSLVVIVWIFAMNAWALIAIDFLPITRHSPWDPTANLRAPLFARYDSGWYDGIVKYGYGPPPPPGAPSAHSFFPLYPEIARLLHLMTGIDAFQTALFVTWASLLFAVPLFIDEARERLGPERALRALPFLLLYPVAFFFTAVYSDALFLLIALLAFRFMRRGEIRLALLAAYLAGLTRAPAAVMGAGLGLAWLIGRKDEPPLRRWGGAALLGVTPFLGVASWIWGIGFAKGEPGLFFRSMGAWRKAAGNPTGGPSVFVEELRRMWTTGHFREHPGALAPYAHFVLWFFVTGLQLWKRRWADAAWSAAFLALPVVTGTSAGIPRYTLTIFPGHLALADLCEGRPVLRTTWLAVYVAVLLLNAAFFTNWHFVS
jgi:hypothetical protein